MAGWWKRSLMAGVLLAVVMPAARAADSWKLVVSPASLAADVASAVRPWREPEKTDTPAAEPSDAEIVSEAVASVLETLRAVGYYEASASLRREGKAWHLQVDAGEPVRVRKIHLELLGAASKDERLRAPAFPLASGDVLHQGRYEDFKQQQAESALERGYYDAHWLRSEIALDLQQRQADIHLVQDSGPRYQFGEVRFLDLKGRPLEGLDEKWLRSLMPFSPEDDVSSRRLFQFQKNLLESRYFADVRVTLLRDQAENFRIPVEVRADTRKPNKMSVGLGYATDVGPRLTLEWQRHLLNERGHGIEASTEISQIRQLGELRYKIPWKHPVEDTLQFLLGLQQDEIDGTRTRQSAIGVQHVVQPVRGWQRTYGLKLSEERFERTGGEHGAQRLLVPSVSFSRLESRGGLDPTSGLRQFHQAETAHPAAFSDAEYVLFRTGVRWLDTFAERHMLLLRADAGAILSPDFAAVPPSVRFYAGGDNSVRGYAYRSLSPRNELNETVGGQYLVSGSLEYAWRWRPTWRPAAFIDVGNAFNTHWQPLEVGVGVGMRWISPVGPVRVDVASAISEPGQPLQLHVTLGAPL